ncbi:hypothetical protein NRIC_36620 [Enterococcus florum]|uniref:YvbJ-like NTF2-like domain-containing protein n=1 Tax=Enterococcus florum TaxID=2480627 RepID=A0A4P5PH68_9ENTE|nr:hypothetical protein [Enterococcus florum]GCF95771.1 hypothetical protein NRIC_36620 [Enterococcus florum]
MTKKRGVLVITSLIVVAVIAVAGFLRYTNSRQATVDRVAEALLAKDTKQLENQFVRFSDGQKVSKNSKKWFFRQAAALKKKDRVLALLNDEELFEIQKGADPFKPAEILPKARYIKVEAPKDAELTAVIQSARIELEQDEKWNKYTLGPLLPGDYPIKYQVMHPKFGLKTIKKTISVQQKDHEEVIEEEALYSNNKQFHKHLLSSAVTYMESMNTAIEEDLDFSFLKASSEKNKEFLQKGFEELRPYLSSFEQQFQTVKIDCDSISVNQALTSVSLDLFVDVQRSTQLIKEIGIDEALNFEEQNAIVSFVYDEQQNGWVIDKMDFETFEQDTDKWENVQSFRADSVKKAIWNKEQQATVI